MSKWTTAFFALCMGLIMLSTAFAEDLSISGTGFFDDFESYPLGQRPSAPWTYSGNSNILVDNTISFSGNQCVKLYGSVGGCWGALLHRELNVSPPFTVDFNIYNGSENLSGCHPVRGVLSLRTGPSWTESGRALIAFDGDGTIRGSSESSGGFIDNVKKGTLLGTFASNEWIYKVFVLRRFKE